MQLNLFQWETIETGEGYQNLSRLNFAEARRHFAQALVICPDHQGARRGQEETEFWEESLAEADPLPSKKALVLLWERMNEGDTWYPTLPVPWGSAPAT
jgi:hypothetical protein